MGIYSALKDIRTKKAQNVDALGWGSKCEVVHRAADMNMKRSSKKDGNYVMKFGIGEFGFNICDGDGSNVIERVCVDENGLECEDKSDVEDPFDVILG